MGFASLSGKAREQWSDDALVVGVSKDRDDRPSRLSLREVWDDRSKHHSDDDIP